MAHFARLDENNDVVEVVVVHNDVVQNLPYPQSEELGVAFLVDLMGGGVWKQTSYNRNFRKNYAGIGFHFDPYLDMFVPPKTNDSFVFNSETGQWDPPVPYPVDGRMYTWDENTVSWVPVSE